MGFVEGPPEKTRKPIVFVDVRHRHPSARQESCKVASPLVQFHGSPRPGHALAHADKAWHTLCSVEGGGGEVRRRRCRHGAKGSVGVGVALGGGDSGEKKSD